MSKRFFNIMAIVFSVSLIFGLGSCKSTPEPETETTVEKPAEPKEPAQPEKKDETVKEVKPVEKPEPAEDKAEPLSSKEIAKAKAAVKRAGDAGAGKFFSKEYKALNSDLKKTIAMGRKNPDKAREDLKRITSDANKMYDECLVIWERRYTRSFAKNDKALLGIEADKFVPADYEKTHKLNKETMVFVKKKDFIKGKAKAYETLNKQKRIHHNLSENLRYISILKRDTENYLQDAEDNEAFIYAPEELAMADEAYQKGMTDYRNYKLKESVSAFTKAKKQAILAARRSSVRRKQAETDALMAATQKRIEEASGLEVLNESGEVVEAKPWNGDEFLKANPLKDLAVYVEEVEVEEPELKDMDEPVKTGSNDSEDIPINSDGTQVKADEQESDYLKLAEEFWQMGVQARNEGNFELAQDYFRKAQAYTDAYEANAMFKTYTVVRRKIATDCLWRISERKDIYTNPYLWPKIWRANRKIIQNPDLIYPGQRLVIPPK